MRTVEHFISGGGAGGGSRGHDIFDPNSGEVQARVSLGTAADLDRAMDAALAAQPGWAATNPQRRARVMFAFKSLVEENTDELAHLLSSEHGKVIADARGDVQRGLEVIEFACGIPHALKGEHTQGAGPGIDVYSMRQPLGVVAGITPFNFPAMIPMWMFGVADRLRQRLHPQAFGARSLGPGPPSRAGDRGGAARRHPPGRPR